MANQYNFTGSHIEQAQGTFDGQRQNMAMLEFDIARLGIAEGGARGSKEVLILSLKSFDIPGRTISTGQINYLNGTVNYLAKPAAQSDITVVFYDYPQEGTRAILERWYSLAYDEATGLMTPSSALKVTGHMIMFQTNGQQERQADLYGVLPTKRPDLAVDFGQGEVMELSMSFAVDRVIWKNFGAVSG